MNGHNAAGAQGVGNNSANGDGEDRAAVDALVRRSGSSFYWALRLLPEEKRSAMFAVYAFCREVDDIADEPGDPQRKREQLQDWRDELDRLWAGVPTEPIARALLRPVHRYGLQHRDFEALIAGMEMDVEEPVRIKDMAELDLYCDRVACAVGRLSARIFGAEPHTADELAAALGRALQLTNILRDLREDADRNRLYLPADVLGEHGVDDTADPQAVLRRPGTVAVCERLAAMAAAHFEQARAVLARCDRRQMRPALIMMEVYRRTLARLTAHGMRPWAEPVAMSRLEKLWVALRYGTL